MNAYNKAIYIYIYTHTHIAVSVVRSTTTKNKYFVKMLWHLLGECVKVTVFLVCSSGTVATVVTFFLKFF